MCCAAPPARTSRCSICPRSHAGSQSPCSRRQSSVFSRGAWRACLVRAEPRRARAGCPRLGRRAASRRAGSEPLHGGESQALARVALAAGCVLRRMPHSRAACVAERPRAQVRRARSCGHGSTALLHRRLADRAELRVPPRRACGPGRMGRARAGSCAERASRLEDTANPDRSAQLPAGQLSRQGAAWLRKRLRVFVFDVDGAAVSLVVFATRAAVLL